MQCTGTSVTDDQHSIVSVQGLWHRYTKDWAVRDVNLTIDKSGIVGLLGSNGAGKSTCMNILCGVLHATRGDVLIKGVNIREQPLEAKRQIGFLPQQAPLHTELTVWEYLRHCAVLRRVAANEVRNAVEHAMKKCGIDHFANRLVGALSGGYRQRVGLAQAILHRPSLVVLDEPTNGLDPNQILTVRKLIRGIAEDCTVLLSTHILSEVEAICDDIKMIENGKIVFDGTIDEFANVVPAHTLVAVFGSTPSESALLALPGVEAVDFVNAHKVRLGLSGGNEAAETIVAHSVEQGWRLRELNLEHHTLEEVFARLSCQDKGCLGAANCQPQ